MSIPLLRNPRLSNVRTTLQNTNLFGCSFADSPNMVFYLKAATFPSRQAGMGQVQWMNGNYYFVRAPNLAGVEDTAFKADFILDENMTAYAYLQNWFEQCFDVETGTIGSSQAAKKNIDLFLISNDGEIKTALATMERCILQRIENVDLTMGMQLVEGGQIIDAPVVKVEIAFELHQVYFWPENGTEGFKLQRT